MSPQFSQGEVKKKHLRRVPVKLTSANTAVLLYENEKCPNPDTCPEKSSCKKCHNEKEFMYHPLVYMTAKCNNGPQCKNRSRFCAFYHTESERMEAERNREDLLRKINRAKASKRSTTPTPSDKPIQSKWVTDGEGPTVVEKLKAKVNTESVKEKEDVPDNQIEVTRTSSGEPSGHSSSIQESNMTSTSSRESQNGQAYASTHNRGYSLSDSGSGSYSSSRYANREVPALIIINEKLRIFPQKVISTRSSGIIYEGAYLDKGISHTVAVKEVELQFLGDDVLTANTLSVMCHRNIITYHTVCYKDDRAYIVMDYHPQTLSSYVRENHGSLIQPKEYIMTPLCKSLLNQLCTAVVYLQLDQRTSHCDLLPDNIFIEMRHDGKHRLVVGDANRSKKREIGDDNFSSVKNRKDMYSYIPPGKVWLSPEERVGIPLTQEQIYQSDMWRLGMLIFYVLTGEEYSLDKTPKIHANIFLNSQPWSNLSSLLLQKDYQLRMSVDSIFAHPAFWHYLPARVGDFYKQIYIQGSSVDIQSLLSLSSVEVYALLYPRTTWIEVVAPANMVENSYFRNDNSIGRLIQLIVNMITHQDSDEFYGIVRQQCEHLRIEPVQFFHKQFPCLIFKLWEILFQEQKRIQKQHNAFSELLSC